jgi:hypothetical protein
MTRFVGGAKARVWARRGRLRWGEADSFAALRNDSQKSKGNRNGKGKGNRNGKGKGNGNRSGYADGARLRSR